VLGSVELRYPFIERLKLGFPLPLELGGIRGVAFADAGFVTRDSLRIWDGTSNRLDDLKVGVGLGLRVQISYFALKFDWAKPLSATDDKSWKFTFGIGTDF
jgi:outer membrane protein assembly factor BamA